MAESVELACELECDDLGAASLGASDEMQDAQPRHAAMTPTAGPDSSQRTIADERSPALASIYRQPCARAQARNSRGSMAAAYRRETVYEPTVTGLPELRPYLAALAQRRRFMWHLARTDLKAEHYDTALGQLWVILDPLLTAAVYFLFRTVIRSPGSAANRSSIWLAKRNRSGV